jgi:ABC-type Fe3+-hydroxamate transport system substrate-binding protein
VLASGEIHDTRIASFFEKYKIPILFLTHNSVESVLGGIDLIGHIMEQDSRTKVLTDSLRKIGRTLADSTKSQIHYRTAMVVSVDPLMVVGGLAYQNDLLHMAGAENVFASRVERYPQITPADLLKAAPEYLLLPSNDDQVYMKLIEKNPEIHLNLPAAQLKHVFQIEPDLVMTPGPRIMEGLAYLIRVLHARINVDAAFDSEVGR